MRLEAIVLCALALGLSTASAQNTGEQNTQALYRMCRNEHDPNFALCLGYISGISDIMGAMGDYNKQKHIKDLGSWSFCAQQPILSYGAIVQTFVNWAQAHPERWSENQMLGVIFALREKFPCPAD